MKTQIFSLAFGGEGIGKVDGKICFVEGALPGEDVEFEALKEDPKFIRGRVIKVLKPSDERTEPECPYYGSCGGCQLQHISYEKELFYKQIQVKDLLERISGITDADIKEMIPSEKPYRYRSSITLHKNHGRYGFVAKNKKDIIAIENCAVAEDAINGALDEIGPGEKGDVTLKSDRNGNAWLSSRAGDRFYIDTYNGFDMYLSPKAFSQANRYVAEKISCILNKWIGTPPENSAFFDAYCGTGLFTFLASDGFHSKTGMDINRTSIDCAKTTLRKHAIQNTRFYKDDAEKKFLELFSRNRAEHNILFLDPPRKGCKKHFLLDLASLEELDKIYYLSCDPSRLARDIKLITSESHFKLGRVQPFDMFPRTKHIEVLAEFTRR